MPRKAKPDTLPILILKDGVFVDEDVRKDKGDQCEVELGVARKIIENGHAQLV